MKDFKFFFVLLFFLAISCDGKKSKLMSEKHSYTRTFKIVINAVITKDDELLIHYTNDPSEEFSSEQLIKQNVIGQEAYQKLEFNFPEGHLPNKFRIDLGERRNINPIKIKDIKILYQNKKINISKELLNHFFLPNNFVRQNGLNFQRLEINDRYDPYLTSTPLLMKKMEIEFH